MAQLSQEEKRVACAAFGLASRMFADVIRDVKKQLKSKRLVIEGLENP